jgi:hypothetical protein
MFGTFIPAFLFAIAQTEIDSSVTSILNSLTPLKHLDFGCISFGVGFEETGLGCFNWTFGKLTFSFQWGNESSESVTITLFSLSPRFVML